MFVSIIGYGRFGKFLHTTFKKHAPDVQCQIFSRGKDVDGLTFFSLQECAKADVIIPCCPIRALQDVLRDIQPYIKPKATIIDICSVKILPKKWIQEICGNHQPYIISHPMFGPESTNQAKDFTGLNLMIEPQQDTSDVYDWYTNFWKKLQVNIIEMSVEEHDKYAAYSINYNHLIGKICQMVDIKPTPIDTKGFQTIYKAFTYVNTNSDGLFWDMQKYNPYSKTMLQEVKKAVMSIYDDLYLEEV